MLIVTLVTIVTIFISIIIFIILLYYSRIHIGKIIVPNYYRIINTEIRQYNMCKIRALLVVGKASTVGVLEFRM